MKKILFFFLLALVSLNSCVDMNDPVEENSTYMLELNGVKYHDGDTVKCLVNQNFRVALLENGIASQAYFVFGNSDTNVSGYQAFITYDKVGTYTLTAESSSKKMIKVHVAVGTAQVYTLKINNQTVSNDSTFKTVTGTKLGFKVVGSDGKKVDAAYDFGNGQKINTDTVATSYAKGNYVLKVTVGSTTIKVNVIVSDEENSGEAIVLISSTISGSTIDAVIGLRCSAINSVDTTKTIYVSGEIPNSYWKDYNIGHTVVIINKIPYFKWNVVSVAGSYRMSWIQLKAGKTEFKYDNCTWANISSSKYWSDGLFKFTTYIENGVAKIKP